MNKHEIIREIAKTRLHWSGGRKDVLNYVDECEATEKELEIYKQLHQKYQYLNENTNDYDLNVDEVTTIHDVIYELEEKIQR